MPYYSIGQQHTTVRITMGGGSSIHRRKCLPVAVPVTQEKFWCKYYVDEMSSQDLVQHLSKRHALVSSLIIHSFPSFTSYSPSYLILEELSQLQFLRSELNGVPNFIEFDHIFFPALSKHCPNMCFTQRPFSFKKKFTVELLDLLTVNKDSFVEDVICFVEEHRQDCADVRDYGSIGEILVSSMYAMHGSAVEKHLWAKAYSKFLLAIVAKSDELDLELNLDTEDTAKTV